VTTVDPLSPGERRVIGCLIEKGATTPDSYPLTTNSLRLACNQSTSRDPIADYSDREIDALMLQLRRRGLARTVSGAGHRVSKHRHIVGEALGMGGPELAVMAVMLLRGPQTVAELGSRTARYNDGPQGADGVNAALDSLAGREEPMARRLATRPGEREPRVEQIWSPVDDVDQGPISREQPIEAVPDQASSAEEGTPSAGTGRTGIAAPQSELADRVAALELALADQTERLDTLIAQLGD